MAVVYLAEQSEPVKRRVALKILKAGMDSKQVVARFESERQALAVLDHPNIAKIFDGGIAESGRPYFVMEHVKGVPITDYCDDHRLNNEDRLNVFIKVCSAVQHAHLKGMIHRDLKPSNIMVCDVDGNPEPKIIDFGIAKATTTTLTDSTLHTRIGQIIGTPTYMSPEQANVTGLDVDTRADIYSLGVILYELLVGAVPLDLHAVGHQAMQLAIREKDPPKPSTRITELGDTQVEIAKARRTEVHDLRRQLRGDLDWIVMQAIEKDRTRRYETANALAMECRRFLANQPVLARPPSAGYLLQRFVQRNRLGVIAGFVVMLAVIGGATAAVFGDLRATEAEQVARQEAETARQVSDFMVDLFEVSDPSEARGNTITAREVLEQGAEKINNATDLEPVIKARLLSTIGSVYQELALYEPASRALTASVQLYKGLPETNPLELASVLDELGLLAGELGDFDTAREHYLEALAIREARLDEPHVDIVRSIKNVSVTYWRQDELDRAEELTGQARAMLDEVPEEHVQLRNSLTNNLANIYSYQGRNEEAEPLQRQLLEARYARYGENHLRTGFAHDNLAITLDALEKNDEAEEHYRKALEILLNVYGDDHPEVAQTMGNVAQFLVARGELDEAEELLLRAIDIYREAIGNDYYMVADSLTSLTEIDLERGRNQNALEKINEAIDIYVSTLPSNHGRTGSARAVQAEVLIALGRYDPAETILQELYPVTAADAQSDKHEYVLELLTDLYAKMAKPELEARYREELSD